MLMKPTATMVLTASRLVNPRFCATIEVMNTWQKSLNAWAIKPFVRQLRTRFGRAEIFLVGGAVRDAALGRATQDVDFVVRNVGKAPLERFLSQHGTVSL